MIEHTPWWAGEYWAITPEAAARISAEAPPSERQLAVTRVGPGHISVVGALSPVDHAALADMVSEDDADAGVESIRVVFDSPGGAVTGAHEAAQAIHSATTPTHAVAVGACCSAAYWLASACDTIEASPAAHIGCLGTLATMMVLPTGPGSPIVRIVSTQTPRKDADPSTDDGHAQHLAVLDEKAAVFLADVAEFRGIQYSEVESNYGRGAVLGAIPALAAGMIDSITGVNPATVEAGMAEQTAEQTGAEAQAPTEDARVEELQKRIAELEAEVKRLEDAAQKADGDAGVEAKPEEVPEDEDPAIAALRAEVSALTAANYAAAKEIAISALVSSGRVLPADRDIVALAYDAEQRGDSAVYSTKYVARAPVIDLGIVAHGGSGDTVPADPRLAMIAQARAYCTAHDMDPDGPDIAAALIAVQHKGANHG